MFPPGRHLATFPGAAVRAQPTRTDDSIKSTIDENLRDCCLIGPDAGKLLRRMVYAPTDKEYHYS